MLRTRQTASTSTIDCDVDIKYSTACANDGSNNMSTKTKVAVTTLVLGIVGITWHTSPLATAILPAILAPTGISLYMRYNSAKTRGLENDIDCLVWTYIIMGTIGMILLIAVQAALAFGLAYLLFVSETEWFLKEFQNLPRDSSFPEEEHRAARAAFAARPSYWVFLFNMAFVIAALCEDYLKYLAINLAKKYQGGRFRTQREYLIYGIVAALSFSTMENVAFIGAACETGDRGMKLVITVFGRIVGGTLGHVLGGLSIALGILKRDEDGQKVMHAHILRRAVLIHGLWDLSLLAISAIRGDIGWVQPEDWRALIGCHLIVIGWMVVLAALIRPELKRIRLD